MYYLLHRSMLRRLQRFPALLGNDAQRVAVAAVVTPFLAEYFSLGARHLARSNQRINDLGKGQPMFGGILCSSGSGGSVHEA